RFLILHHHRGLGASLARGGAELWIRRGDLLVCSSTSSRTVSLALICGLMRRRSSTFCRWMGAYKEPRPPSPIRFEGMPVVVPVVPVVLVVPVFRSPLRFGA